MAASDQIEVVIGALFCWRTTTERVRIGEYTADHGQVLWKTTADAPRRMERAFALVGPGGRQLRVEDVSVRVGKPVMLEIRSADLPEPCEVPVTEFMRAAHESEIGREWVNVEPAR